MRSRRNSTSKPVAIYKFTYPEGARNCEAVGADVGTQKILLVTKERDPGCEVYALPLLIDAQGTPQNMPEQPLHAALVAKIQVPTITGLAVHPQERRIVLLGRGQLFEFTRPAAATPDTSEPFMRLFKVGPGSSPNLSKSKAKPHALAPTAKSSILLARAKINRLGVGLFRIGATCGKFGLESSILPPWQVPKRPVSFEFL